jgi:hypothetical protein
MRNNQRYSLGLFKDKAEAIKKLQSFLEVRL